jgi:hypothetical protein
MNQNYVKKLGRKTWIFLHELTNGIDMISDNNKNDKYKEMNTFMNSLSNVYPCHKCSTGLKKINKNIKFSKHIKATKTMNDIHNAVTNSIKK